MTGKLNKRQGRVLDTETTPSKHPVFKGFRKRTFGFHTPQKLRAAKVQHPKPKATDKADLAVAA